MKYKRKKRTKRIMESKQGAENLTPETETANNEGEIKIEDASKEQAVNAEVKAESDKAREAEKAPQKDEAEPTQEEWAEALKKTVAERDSYKDSYLRSQAEFQNFKRRNSATRAEAFEDGTRETIAAMLPAIDNLELALKHAKAQGDDGAFVKGVEMTLKLMTDALGKLGLEEVPALGEEFDPDKHNAVMREPGGEENKICEVFQKGYKVHDKMIRYAMVKVYSGAEA